MNWYYGTPGYNLVTGIGSPIANSLVTTLASNSYTFPTVTSIGLELGTVNPVATIPSSVVYQVNFSEPVSVAEMQNSTYFGANFALAASNSSSTLYAGGNIGTPVPSGGSNGYCSVYDVSITGITVFPFTANATLQLVQIPCANPADNITDANGNPLMGTNAGQIFSILQTPATLALAAGYQYTVAPTLVVSAGYVSTTMGTGTWNLLGNSSGGSITLDASQFPARSQVEIWNSSTSSYTQYVVDATGWVGGVAPVITANEAFWVYTTGAMTLNLQTTCLVNYTYQLSNATVTLANNNTYSLSYAIHKGWVTIYAYDPTTGYEELTATDSINSWEGYVIYANQSMTVTFGA